MCWTLKNKETEFRIDWKHGRGRDEYMEWVNEEKRKQSSARSGMMNKSLFACCQLCGP
jgi:hypothetical protein